MSIKMLGISCHLPEGTNAVIAPFRMLCCSSAGQDGCRPGWHPKWVTLKTTNSLHLVLSVLFNKGVKGERRKEKKPVLRMTATWLAEGRVR